MDPKTLFDRRLMATFVTKIIRKIGFVKFFITLFIKLSFNINELKWSNGKEITSFLNIF